MRGNIVDVFSNSLVLRRPWPHSGVQYYGSGAHVCVPGTYFLKRQIVKKQINCVSIFTWIRLNPDAIHCAWVSRNKIRWVVFCAVCRTLSSIAKKKKSRLLYDVTNEPSDMCNNYYYDNYVRSSVTRVRKYKFYVKP